MRGGSPSAPGPVGRPWLWLLLAALAVGGATAVVQGQDGTWDFRAYHWYLGWSFWHPRLDHDLGLSGPCAFFNPLLDGANYALLSLSPRWGTAALGAIEGVGLALLGGLVLGLTRDWGASAARALAVAGLAVALAAGGAMTFSLTGTTTDESQLLPLTAAALLALVRAAGEERPGRRALLAALAALLGGAATALKLTNATYALGGAFTGMWLLAAGGGWRLLWAPPLGGLAGFLLLYGHHGLELSERYGNPFFPFLNNLFHSPWVVRPEAEMGLRPHGLASAVRALGAPAGWATGSSTFSEAPFRDPRVLLGVLAAAAVLAAVRPAAAARGAGAIADRRLRAAAVFLLASFGVWAASFRLARYALSLEAIGATLSLLLLARLTRAWRTGAALLVLALFAAGVSAVTVRPRWGRIPFAAAMVEAPRLAIPAGAVVLLVDRPDNTNQLTHLVPGLEPRARYVQAWSMIHAPDDGSLLSAAVREALAGPGPRFALFYRDRERETLERILRAYGLRVARERREFTSNSTGEVIVFARLAPARGAPAAPGVPRPPPRTGRRSRVAPRQGRRRRGR